MPEYPETKEPTPVWAPARTRLKAATKASIFGFSPRIVSLESAIRFWALSCFAQSAEFVDAALSFPIQQGQRRKIALSANPLSW